ncbi:hypothetical protein A9R10_18945 [Aeromonas piscicola]|uniref:type II RES/Xre toxin-antitoxin system antitoxin n=1 Tax=Aeromonas hydrophila TaxID=644 RepID=UPI0008085706|nr:antitoxin Xre/MbcA/ParS toxin-binding domain-containing protein [Aeromonas hydrophila]NHT35118.1 DUF2384 domain-containing protein [Aeromonas hydrophila]OCA59858.1 hypothetical protein A9R10_18945 [Aeromonas piscicola]TNH90794.1 hypothetical protein CF139_05295 [Aeromonas hydrophila]
MNVGTPYKPLQNRVGKPDGLLDTLFLPQQPFDAHWKILSGFSFDIVTQLSILIQVDEVTICQLANISYVTDTKNRKQGKVFSTEQSIRLYVFIKTLEATLQLFDGDVSAALQWLKLPSKALGGESPIQMLSTPPGAEAVMDLIGRIEHGVIT